MAAKTATRRRTTAEVVDEQAVPGDQLVKRIKSAARLQKRIDAMTAEIAEMKISTDLANANDLLNEEVEAIREAMEKGLKDEGERVTKAAGYVAKLGKKANVTTVTRKAALINYLRKKAGAKEFLELISIKLGDVRDYVPKKDLAKFTTVVREGARRFSFGPE